METSLRPRRDKVPWPTSEDMKRAYDCLGWVPEERDHLIPLHRTICAPRHGNNRPALIGHSFEVLIEKEVAQLTTKPDEASEVDGDDNLILEKQKHEI